MHAKNFNDLIGQVFGCYKVINEAPQRIQPNGNIVTMWHMKCIYCGYEKDTSVNHLKNRPNTCPKCSKKTTLEDLKDRVVGFIKVLERAPGKPKSNGKKRTMWKCVCLLCGKEFVMQADTIKSGKQISCGCLGGFLKSQSKLKDYTGERVGRLYVKERLDDRVKPSGGTVHRWLCLCDCGKNCIKTSDYLRTSPSPSCGCWKREITSELKTKNIIGETVGFLKVIEKIETKHTRGGNAKAMYRCVCLNCGSTVEVSAGSLLNGQTRSCGCVKSYGEFETRRELIRRNICFKTQYRFEDLYMKNKNHPLLFDFAIFDNDGNLLCLIEFQGKQHYIPTDKNGWFGKQQREITDRLKKEYCNAHGITLCEIRYDESISDAIDRILTTQANFVPSLV